MDKYLAGQKAEAGVDSGSGLGRWGSGGVGWENDAESCAASRGKNRSDYPAPGDGVGI